MCFCHQNAECFCNFFWMNFPGIKQKWIPNRHWQKEERIKSLTFQAVSLEQQTKPRPHDSYCCPLGSPLHPIITHQTDHKHLLATFWDTFGVTFLVCKSLDIIKIPCQLRLVAARGKQSLSLVVTIFQFSRGHNLPSWPYWAVFDLIVILHNKYDLSCTTNKVCHVLQIRFIH